MYCSLCTNYCHRNCCHPTAGTTNHTSSSIIPCESVYFHTYKLLKMYLSCNEYAYTYENNCPSFCSLLQSDYIAAAQNIELYSQMLDSHGKSLLEYILQAIAGASPRSHLDPLTDILFSLNKNSITSLSAWLQVRMS